MIKKNKRNRRILDWVGDAFGALGIFASIYFFMLLAYGLGY
jgi:hypothetical protein